MATSMKLALVRAGIRQQQIIRAAAKQGSNLNAGWVCKIINGQQPGSEAYREAIRSALVDLGMDRAKVDRLLPR